MGERKDLTVVGDAAQCLPTGTLIETSHGPQKVEKKIKEAKKLFRPQGEELPKNLRSLKSIKEIIREKLLS